MNMMRPNYALLTKAVGQFKHSGKYFLLHGRWRKIHDDKPVPKGAAIAAHPHAAGQHAPIKHFTDEQWDQLKLPESNTNAGTYNSQLQKLKEMSEAGHVTGILGAGYGTNTYGKKLATIANKLLEMHGSEHKVTPGQKAGEHHAVQGTPVDAAPKQEERPDAEPKEESQPEQSADLPSVGSVSDPLPEKSGGGSALSMPAFKEGKTTKGVVAYYEKVAQKVIDLAAAGDAAGLEQMKADGLKPNKNGKISNTWTGYTPNSKKLLALHEAALKHAGGNAPQEPAAAPALAQEEQPKPKRVIQSKKPEPAPAQPSKLSQIPWDSFKLPESNSNSKSHNGQVDKIKAMAEAGDIAGLEAYVASKAGAKQTYAKKQHKYAQLALAALKEDAEAPKPATPSSQDALAQAAAKMAEHKKATIAAVEAAGYGVQESPTKGLLLAKHKGGMASTYANQTQASNAVQKLADAGIDASVIGSYPFLVAIHGVLPGKAAPADEGPKEGDTKPAADGGTLVFHNGRWHKQEQEQPEPEQPQGEQHPIDAVPMPSLEGWTSTQQAKLKESLDLLKKKLKAGDLSVLKGATKKMANGKFIINLPHPFGIVFMPLKVKGFASVGPLYDYVEALKAAAGKPPKKSKSAAKPKQAAAPASSTDIESMDSWEQTGPQGGSNPGGRFKDQNGVEWYCKFPSDEDVAKSEVLAAQLYAIAGVAGQDAKLVTKNGKLGIASRWIAVKKASAADLAKTPGALAGFAVDAWLANWDVVGLSYDNLQVNEKGEAVRVDAGGSLMYRAQGGKKAFGPVVSELDSLRDPKINAQAAAVFGKMTDADIMASVAKVLAIPDAAIINAVEVYGPGDTANKKQLAETLIARKADLAAKFPKAVKPPKKRLDPTKLPVTDDVLPKAHDFHNWNGAGKGLSSQSHVNQANIDVENEMLAVAKTGNLTKLKEFQFKAIDKATGQPTGQMLPIAQHPSKHVVQFHADLVQILDEIANPPQPLKVFHETDVGTVEQLAAALPPKKFGTTVKAVHSNEKLGFWVVLGTAHGAQKFKPAKVMDYTQQAIDAAYAKFKQASYLAKHFINSVQASGSYNDLFRDGKEYDHKGNKLTDVAKAALEHATSMPEGTTVYRWQNMPDDMVKKIMAAPDGTVFQATGPMCTSYSPTATSSFGQHRIVIRYAKGAKAVESFASGNFASEKEVTTLPNARFVILSKKMVPNEKSYSKERMELEVLMLPPDLGI